MKKSIALDWFAVCKMEQHSKHRLAFTLAEVLITLGIIGVVAAMTMPTLIAKHQEKERIVKLKKVYSTIQQAYLLAVNENGTPDNWDLKAKNSPEGAKNFMDIFTSYLNTTKICLKNDFTCASSEMRYLHGGTFVVNDPNMVSAILADASTIHFVVRNPDCKNVMGTSKELSSVCGSFDIDINGNARPNQVGKDWFAFYITKYNIIPVGTDGDGDRFSYNCLRRGAEGFACAAWVIFNENMDYLHCDDLDWNTKTKCK